MYVIILDSHDLDVGIVTGPTFETIEEVIEYLDEHPDIQNFTVKKI